MGQQHADTTYKTVTVEYINTDYAPGKSVRRVHFRINDQEEWLDLTKPHRTESILREFERLLNKVLAY